MRSVRCGSPSFPTSAAPSWGRRPKSSSSLRPRNSLRAAGCSAPRSTSDFRRSWACGVRPAVSASASRSAIAGPCAPDLGGVERAGQRAADTGFTIDAMARAESRRAEFNNAMAAMFDQADIVLAATNPSTAFGAEATFPAPSRAVNPTLATTVRSPPRRTSTATRPSHCRPALPATDCPSACRFWPPFREDLLLDLALQWEREHPVELARDAGGISTTGVVLTRRAA